MKNFLTIAASDNSGGAGIQKDISVAHDIGLWPLSAITGITVQNFSRVISVSPVLPSLLEQQIAECLASFDVSAIKIGAICSEENVDVIAKCLSSCSVKHIVLDPVIASTSGKLFLTERAIGVLRERIFPLTELITPNKPEFELLTNTPLHSLDEAIDIAKTKTQEWNTSILLKGGHFTDSTIREALVTPSSVFLHEHPRVNFTYQHGTGCTLSSAIACFLGKGEPLNSAYLKATDYLVGHYIGCEVSSD